MESTAGWSVVATKKGGLPIRTERRPKGKTVTVLGNVSRADELRVQLQRACGCGGVTKGHAIELQGDCEKKLRAFLMRNQDKLKGLRRPQDAQQQPSNNDKEKDKEKDKGAKWKRRESFEDSEHHLEAHTHVPTERKPRTNKAQPVYLCDSGTCQWRYCMGCGGEPVRPQASIREGLDWCHSEGHTQELPHNHDVFDLRGLDGTVDRALEALGMLSTFAHMERGHSTPNSRHKAKIDARREQADKEREKKKEKRLQHLQSQAQSHQHTALYPSHHHHHHHHHPAQPASKQQQQPRSRVAPHAKPGGPSIHRPGNMPRFLGKRLEDEMGAVGDALDDHGDWEDDVLEDEEGADEQGGFVETVEQLVDRHQWLARYLDTITDVLPSAHAFQWEVMAEMWWEGHTEQDAFLGALEASLALVPSDLAAGHHGDDDLAGLGDDNEFVWGELEGEGEAPKQRRGGNNGAAKEKKEEWPAMPVAFAAEVEQLVAMGFTDRDLVARCVREAGGDVSSAMESILAAAQSNEPAPNSKKRKNKKKGRQQQQQQQQGPAITHHHQQHQQQSREWAAGQGEGEAGEEESAVQQLVAMGFAEGAAVAALGATGGDVQRACGLLIA